MFGLFNRSRSAVSKSSSSTRTPVMVEGLEGRSMMSVTLNPGTDAALLPAVHTGDVPAIQHGLLPYIHPAGATSSNPGAPAPTGFIIAVL